MIKIALLGLGQRGLQHLEAIWQLQTEGLVKVVALGDAFPQNLTEEKIKQYVSGFQADGIVHSTNFADLLATKPDAIYLCLPPNVHQGELLVAAKAGIHIFAEKPMSLYLDEAIEMERAIGEAGILTTVGFQQRFDVRHEAMQQFLADKQTVLAEYTMHAPIEAHNAKHTLTETVGGPVNRVWTANRAWSGGTIVEAGIHPLDLWRYWMGDVEWVQATYIQRPPEAVIDGADNPYAYAVQFGFVNGAVGSMNLSRLRRVFATLSEHQILWTEGRLRLEGAEVAAYQYDGPYPPAETPDPATVRHALAIPKPVDTTLAIARAFVTAIAEERPELIRSSFSDAMNSLAAVIGANVSDELGGKRVYLAELLADDAFVAHRRKPVA